MGQIQRTVLDGIPERRRVLLGERHDLLRVAISYKVGLDRYETYMSTFGNFYFLSYSLSHAHGQPSNSP